KLLEDLKELTERNHPTFFDNNEDHSVQYKEYLENYSKIAASNSNQEKEGPPQDFDIRQLIREECCIEVCEEQKQNMEDTMLELVEICRQKEFYWDEHLGTILETESDKVIKSSVENLVPIPSEFEDFSDNENTLIESSPKFDYLLEKFSGELAHNDPVPLGIEKADFDLEEEICLVENLLYDNSSPQPPEELNAEIDLFLATDELMPPSIENDDYDSEGDIHFLEELLSNDTLPIPKNDSSNFDHHDDLSFPRPPPKPSNVEIFFDFEPNTGVLTSKVVEDILNIMIAPDLEASRARCFVHRLLEFQSLAYGNPIS
nr:hypothetical protein [Tanacetum cinerariifolium]